MHRARALTHADDHGASRSTADETVLPSRAEAFAALRAALSAQDGPALLTGEPGVGKTWLCRRLRPAMPPDWRWAVVDLSPAVDPRAFYRLVLHGLGHGEAPGEARAAIDGALRDAAADGERWALVVDEAHTAPPAVLEEVRVLGNRMGRPGAFAGLVLVGQTALARRLATRPLAPLAARLAARIHLRPLDVEELSRWLARLEPGRAWDAADVEQIHRAVGGNPRRFLRFGRIDRDVEGLTLTPQTAQTPEPARVAPAVERPTTWEVPPVAPVKPPLAVGDGMIEVGWEASPEPEPTPAVDPDPRPFAPSRAPTAPSDEAINDHYAALQAWTEWARNEGRAPVAATADGSSEDDPAEPDPGAEPRSTPPLPGPSSVWAEGEHAFAPYSQLFSRLRQARDTP